MILEDDVIRRHFTKLVQKYIMALDELTHVKLAYQAKQKFCVQYLACQESKCCIHISRGNPCIEGDNNKLPLMALRLAQLKNVPSIDKCLEETENFPVSSNKPSQENKCEGALEGVWKIRELEGGCPLLKKNCGSCAR